MYFKRILNLFKSSFARYQEADAHDLGAALAYFTIFSLVPLFSIIILIAGFFLNEERVTTEIINTIQGSIGTNAASFLSDMLSTANAAVPNVFATIIGFFVLLYSVVGVTSQLQNSLNRILGIPERKMTFIHTLWQQLSSFSIILLGSIVLVFFFTLSASFTFFATYIDRIFPFPLIYLQLTNFLLSFLLIFSLTIIIFRFLPRIKISWKSILIGALATSLLFVLGRFIISLYVTYLKPASAYGAAGALIVILLWIYYSAQIFFFGASVMYAHSQKYVSKIEEK